MTWSLTYIMCKQLIGDNEKCRQIAGDFDCHADEVVRCGAHCPYRASLEATGCCHWASACIVLPRRPPWPTIVVKNTKHYQKTIFSYRSQKLWEFCTPKQTLYSAHQCNKLRSMWNAALGAEELADISMYQTLWGEKIGKVIKQSRISIYKLAHMRATSGKAVVKR
jgi:hypothetical protein